MSKAFAFLLFEIKRAFRHFLPAAALILALAAVLTGIGTIFARYADEDRSVSPFPVAVNIPEGAGLHYSIALGMVTSMDSFSSMVEVKRTSDEAKARAMLESGEARAAVLIPEGMIHGIMYGSNIPATVLYPGTPGIESVLFKNMVESLSRMLSDSQSGVYALDEVYAAAGMSDSASTRANTAANDRYIDMVLARGDNFVISRTEEGEQNSLYARVAAGMIALMLLLSGCSLAGYCSAESDVNGAALKRFGLRAPVRAACTVAGGFLLLYVLSLLLLAAAVPLSGKLGLSLPPFGHLAAALAAGCMVSTALSFFLARTIKSYGKVIITLFCVSFLAVFAAGGLLPAVFLPKAFGMLDPVNPGAWLIRVLGTAIAGKTAAGPLCLLLALSLILVLLGAFATQRKTLIWGRKEEMLRFASQSSELSSAGVTGQKEAKKKIGFNRLNTRKNRFSGWLAFQASRQLFRPVSLIGALLILVCAVFLHTDAATDKRIRIGLYAASPDKVTGEILDELAGTGSSRLYQFVKAGSEDELREMVQSKEAECAFFLPDDVLSVLMGESEEKIEILCHPDTTLELMAREEVYEAIFRRFAPVWLENYLLSDTKLTGLSEEEIKEMAATRYAYWLSSGETFHVVYEDVEEGFFRDETAFRLPVPGMIALLLYVCTAAGISQLKRDIRGGRVILRKKRAYFPLALIYTGLALALPVIFSLVCLFAGGSVSFSAQALAAQLFTLVVYCVCLIAFNTALGAVTGEGYLFELLIAPIVIFCLLYSPAVFSLETYLPLYPVVRYFAPASWYWLLHGK